MANKVIDLRSDTVTLPTESMRRAMYEAELGDDVFGEDPTVNRLQEMSAERMGKEAALLVTSGTQGNLVGIPHAIVRIGLYERHYPRDMVENTVIGKIDAQDKADGGNEEQK